MRSSVAASSHCKSSRNSASGCSLRANTPRKRRKTIWKRFFASCGGRSATGGCFPITSSSSGTRLTMRLTIRAQGLPQRVPPLAKLDLAFAQDMADQALERLRQGGVRNVALVLVELAGREQAARRNEHLVQLIDHRGLADAGIAGDQHEFRRAIRHDAVEGREQRVDLALPPVQPLRDQQSVRGISRAAAGTARCGRAPPIPLGSCRRSASRPAAVW